jgi:hypothetical protein
MKVIASVDADVKLNGIIIPFSFVIIEGLAYDAILGMNFLNTTHSVIDLTTNTLSIYKGLTSIPMTRRITTADVVYTVANVSIPPRSEAIIPVAASIKRQGNYIIEHDLQSKCRALAIARSLVDPSQSNLQCRVLNPTDKTIRLRTRTSIGTLAAVDVETTPTPINHVVNSELPPMAIMRQAVEAKGISFKQTSVTGKDLDDLITFLYRNRDLMATNLKDLVGTDAMLMKIDTQNHPPIRSRPYLHSPADKAEVSCQVREMLDANIIYEHNSPWAAPVLVVKKRWVC